MSDHIDHIRASGDTASVLKATVVVAQKLNDDFEELAIDCENSNGHGGCLINTADGCLILSCPLTREDK